jgi:hypothetical protein
MRFWLVGLIALIAVLALRSPVHADERDEAAGEFAAGQAADRRKDYQTAIRHYLRANELVPHPNAMFNIATDYEKLGNWREAVTWYQRYLDEARNPPDRERILRLIRELQTRVPPEPVVRNGTLRVIGPIGAQVFIDDQPVGQIPLATELPVGRHAVRVTHDRFVPFEATVEIFEQRVSIARARMERATGAPGAIDTPTTKIKAGYLFGVGGGIDLKAQGPLVLVDLGVQALKYDVAARIGKANGFTTVDLVVRAALGNGRLAPYIGGGYSFIGGGTEDGTDSASTTGGGYALIGGLRYEVSRSEHAFFAVIAESGLRFYGSNGGDSSVMIPLMASVQVVYK